jgi:hypothetical protein
MSDFSLFKKTVALARDGQPQTSFLRFFEAQKQQAVPGRGRPELLSSTDYPWYLQQPFPFWSQFITVPLFSILSSLSNLQWRELDLVVMVIISCISFAVKGHYRQFSQHCQQQRHAWLLDCELHLFQCSYTRPLLPHRPRWQGK